MNIKYYNFGSSFDTTEFCSRNINVDAEAIYSMIQEKHLTLRCTLRSDQHLRVLPVCGSTVESGPLIGTALGSTGRERRTTCI
jgi:hypothetical protein